ncbi:putative PIN7 domain-containing protein [Vibrio chagasii]|nr:putative PIN7 domain-containing protein [Vibrio chagasii]
MVSMHEYNSLGEYLSDNYLTGEATPKEFALKIGTSESNLRRLLRNESDITPKIALLLERFSGVNAEEWMRLGSKSALQKVREAESIDSSKHIKTKHILIDGENITPSDFEALAKLTNFKLWFLFNHDDRKQLYFMSRLFKFKDNLEMIPVSKRDKNALDFHITYLIGEISTQEPNSEFFVVSKDSGFDALLDYLRAQGRVCERVTSLAGINPPSEVNTDEFVYEAAKQLILLFDKDHAPKTIESLTSTIGTTSGLPVSPRRMIEIMVELGLFSIKMHNNTEIPIYNLETVKLFALAAKNPIPVTSNKKNISKGGKVSKAHKGHKKPVVNSQSKRRSSQYFSQVTTR